ncbi:hypothetical protein ACVWZK_003994 [Bradyrhizobium sp. GM0.4]
MYYVAAALLVLSGLFYSASHHEIGSFGVTMCTYGSAFCNNPLIVFCRRRAGRRLGHVRQHQIVPTARAQETNVSPVRGLRTGRPSQSGRARNACKRCTGYSSMMHLYRCFARRVKRN